MLSIICSVGNLSPIVPVQPKSIWEDLIFSGFSSSSFCFFVTLTLIKNEGAALLLILFIVTLSYKFLKGDFLKDISKIIYFSSSFIPIILWKYFCFSKGIGNDYINSNFIENLSLRLYDFENIKLLGYFYY